MNKAGRLGDGGIVEVLQRHMVQEQMAQLGHGDGLLTQVGHGVVAQLKAGQLGQSGQEEGFITLPTLVVVESRYCI